MQGLTALGLWTLHRAHPEHCEASEADAELARAHLLSSSREVHVRGSPMRLSVEERPPSLSPERRPPDSGGRPCGSSLKRRELLLAKALCRAVFSACLPGLSPTADFSPGPSAGLPSTPAVAGLQASRSSAEDLSHSRSRALPVRSSLCSSKWAAAMMMAKQVAMHGGHLSV